MYFPMISYISIRQFIQSPFINVKILDDLYTTIRINVATNATLALWLVLGNRSCVGMISKISNSGCSTRLLLYIFVIN